MIHYMNLWSASFEMIKSGIKTIEMRVFDEKRKIIHKGDIIEFVNTSSGEKIQVFVLQLHIFKNFDELYAKFDKTVIGYKKDEIANSSDMNVYYSKDVIDQYGVVGIEVRLMN